MRLSPSTRRTLATIAAFLMLLVGLLLAASKVDDDSSGDPNPAPSSSPSAPASTAPADPSPSTPLTSEPTTSEPIPSPTDPAYNIFDPECPAPRAVSRPVPRPSTAPHMPRPGWHSAARGAAVTVAASSSTRRRA